MDFEKIEQQLREAKLHEPSEHSDTRIRAMLCAAPPRGVGVDRTVFYLLALAAAALISLLVFMNLGGDATPENHGVSPRRSPVSMAVDEEDVSEKIKLSNCYVCIAKDGVMVAEHDFAKGQFVAFPKEMLDGYAEAKGIPANDSRHGYVESVMVFVPNNNIWLLVDDGKGLWSLGLKEGGWRASYTEELSGASISWQENGDITATLYDYETDTEYREKRWQGKIGADGKLKWELVFTGELCLAQTASFGGAWLVDGEQEFVLADQRIVTIDGASATCFLYRGISGGKLRLTWSRNCDHEETLAEFEFAEGEHPTGDHGNCKFLQFDIKDDLSFTCTLSAAAFQGWQDSGGMSMGKYHTYLHRSTDSARTWATVLDKVWEGRELLDCVKLD